MSSGRTSEDDKTITFEINSNQVVGRFTLSHIDGDDLNKPRILMRMTASGSNYPSSIDSTTSVLIPKEKTVVLSHMFRQFADLMDKWYEKELEGTHLART